MIYLMEHNEPTDAVHIFTHSKTAIESTLVVLNKDYRNYGLLGITLILNVIIVKDKLKSHTDYIIVYRNKPLYIEYGFAELKYPIMPEFITRYNIKLHHNDVEDCLEEILNL